MAGSKSNAHETKVLNYWLGKSFTSTAPANVYIRLYNSTVNDAITNATDQAASGVGANNYGDVTVVNSSANWTNSSAGGSKTNKTAITFTPGTGASTGWGTIQAMSISISSSTTTGDIIYWADLTVDQVVSQGNTVRFSTGAIVITED